MRRSLSLILTLILLLTCVGCAQSEPEEPDGINGGILLIVFGLLVGGVVLYYFKGIRKKPRQKVPSYTDEYDMDDDEIWEKEV